MFIILGIVAGAIAQLVMKGKQGTSSWILNIVLGVIGALLGTVLGNIIFHGGKVSLQGANLFNIGTWVMAIIGCIIVFLIKGLITRNRT